MGQNYYTVAPAYKMPAYSRYNNLEGSKHSSDICGDQFAMNTPEGAPQVSGAGCDKYVFACENLTMGSWRRTKHSNKTNSDLIVECDGKLKALVYYVIFNGVCFRAVVSFDSIVNASICPDVRDSLASYLVIQVSQPPTFTHRNVHDGTDWKVCEDFTCGQAATARQHWLRGPTNKLTENLETLRFMRCESYDIIPPPYRFDCHSDYDLSIACEEYDLDEPSIRPALARSQSAQSTIEDAFATDKSELRMSRQMSMPNLARYNSHDANEEGTESCDNGLDDLEMFKPFSSAPTLELTLPKIRDLSVVSSPSPVKEELDLLLPLSLQSSRADSPICSKQGELPMPSLFSKSDIFYQNRPSTPFEADPLCGRPISPHISDAQALLAQEGEGSTSGLVSFWDEAHFNC